MLALKGEAAAGESEDIFEMAADGKQRRGVERQRDGERNKAAGAANELRRAVDERHDRVVAALKDFAVVHEEGVGDASRRARASLLSMAMGSSLRLALVITRALDAGS